MWTSMCEYVGLLKFLCNHNEILESPYRFDYDNAEFNLFLYDLSVIFGSGDFMNCAVYLNSPGLALLAAITVSSLQVGR